MSVAWILGGLCSLLVALLSAPVALATPDLDPSAPHVCSRDVRETRLVLSNQSMTCWRTEYSDPPCQGDFWSSSWFFRGRGSWRSGRGGYHGRRRRQALSTTPWPPTWTTSTARTTSTALPREDSDNEDSDFAPNLCCRRVEHTCWFVREMCIIITTRKYFCCHGYEPDGLGGCQLDIECSSNNGGCDQLCNHDDEEGHHCSCFSGYKLTDQTTCTDIDECAVNNGGCNQDCVNVPGSYFCTCRSGYILTSPHQCTEVNECEVNNGGCDQDCVNTDGAFYCECEQGFDLVNGTQCVDRNECRVNNGQCSDVCVNEYGGYYCDCPEGTELDESGFTCISEDEPEGPNALPVSSEAQLLFQPRVYGSILAGVVLLVLLILLAALCCRRARRRGVTGVAAVQESPAVTPTSAHVFFPGTSLGKAKAKAKLALGVGADLGEKPPMYGYDAESIEYEYFEDGDDEKKKMAENEYVADPLTSLPGDAENCPPPYSKEPDPYENVVASDGQHTYSNLAYEMEASDTPREGTQAP